MISLSLSNNLATWTISWALKSSNYPTNRFSWLKASTFMIFFTKPTWLKLIFSSLMASSRKLSKAGGDSFSKSYTPQICSLCSAVCYSYKTWISFAVNKVCQFKATPLYTHWVEIKRILWYLTLMVLWNMWKSREFYADWTSDIDDRRSTSGSARTDKQQVIVRSSMECAKHMEVNVFYLHEKVLSKQLQIYHIPALDQWTDLPTKPLSPTRFVLVKDKLNVRDISHAPPPWVWGGLLGHIRIKEYKRYYFLCLYLSVTLFPLQFVISSCPFQWIYFGFFGLFAFKGSNYKCSYCIQFYT